MAKLRASKYLRTGVTLKNHKGKQLTKNGKVTQETKEQIDYLISLKKAKEDRRRISTKDLSRMINL